MQLKFHSHSQNSRLVLAAFLLTQCFSGIIIGNLYEGLDSETLLHGEQHFCDLYASISQPCHSCPDCNRAGIITYLVCNGCSYTA